MNCLHRFKDIHKKGIAVVIGNGPSLNDTPLEKLNYITFGSNMIFRKPFTPDYYCIIDEEMMNACLPLPNDFAPKEKFIRAEAAVGNPIYPVVANGFSTDMTNFVVMGGTVTYALLQIAWYMGIETVLLVGVDHHYPMASRYNRKFVGGETDIDHFQPADGKPYFKTGKIFNAPELEGTARNYAIAQELFTKDRRRILNLTPDTKLDVFPKDKLSNWI